MNLLLATDEYLPHLGGVPRVIAETGRRLQARGHQVSILTLERDRSLLGQSRVIGVPVDRIPLRGRLSTYLRALIGSWRAFHRRLAEGDCDILHIHLPLIGLGAMLQGKTHRIPMVYTFYGPWHGEMATELRAKPLRPVIRQLYGLYVSALCLVLRGWQGWVMSRCDRVIVLSEHSRQEIAALFPTVKQEQVTLIPGGVDVERFRPAPDRTAVRQQLGLPPDKTILLTVRRLVPRMGLENLLHAFAEASRGQGDLYLVVAGRGRLADPLNELADQLGIIGRVRFTGFVPEEDLPAYYQAADLFILPTQALEGFGLITLEALSSGLPVVGTPVGSTPEILGWFDARFLTTGIDSEALAQGIRCGIEIMHQEGTELARRCREFAVDHYDWERIVDQYEVVYTEMAEQPFAH